MRKDMSKVIVERPRHDHAGKRYRPGRTRVVTDDDGEPLRAREPMRRADKTKNLNENLAPLKRYLNAQVGRPWNKVYADIAENLRPSSTVQQHVRDHVEDFVAIRTRMKDGVVMTASARFGSERPLAEDYRQLYVHPRSGLLKVNPHWRTWRRRWEIARAAEAKARAHRMRELDEWTQLHLLNDGAWWLVELATKPHKHDVRPAVVGREDTDARYIDVISRAKLSDLPIHERYGRDYVHAIAKRQLSKAEKKSYGLD